MPPYQLPHRIFAIGGEPIRVRVTPYHKPCAIPRILNTLDPDEVKLSRVSPFGNKVLRSDLTMTKDLNPIAKMFPYLLKQVRRTTAHDNR
ncbi:hypothetical protein Bca4012_010782 [Brassica carinata]